MFRLTNGFLIARLSITSNMFKPVRTSKWLFSTNQVRFATSSKDNNEEFAQFRMKEITNKITSNENVFKAYQNLNNILIEKKLIKPEDPNYQPSAMEMFKIVMDKDVQLGIQNIKKEMSAANIEITKEELEPLINILRNKIKK